MTGLTILSITGTPESMAGSLSATSGFIVCALGIKLKALSIVKGQIRRTATMPQSSTAKAVSVSGGNLTITPVAPSSTENIGIDNSGLITREYETTCYHIDLVQNTGDGVMYAYPHGTNQYNGGIGYHITEEIKMYGAGTYKFSLKAMCQPLEGGAYTPVYLIFSHDTEDAYTGTYDTGYTLTGDWNEYTKTFTVTEDMVKNGIGFSIYITGYNNVPVEYYAVKDMVVTKVS